MSYIRPPKGVRNPAKKWREAGPGDLGKADLNWDIAAGRGALAEATEGWAGFKEFATQAPNFYTNQNSHGEQDGFVMKKLSTDPEVFTPPEIAPGTPLGEIIEATKGCFLIVSLGLEEDAEGKYEPKVTVNGTEAV